MKTLHLLLLVLLCGTAVRAAPAARANASIRTLYLVRHGAYDREAKDDAGRVLTSLGIAQARLVGARLRAMPAAFDSLVASSMTRATQTAMVIRESFPGLAFECSDLLRECTPATRRADIMAGEKPAELAAAEKQLEAAFAKYFVPATDRDRSDVLVCHGNVMRWFVCKALGVDTKAWLGISVAHCSLTVIQVTPQGTYKVLAVGDVGHIPPNLQSGLTLMEPQLVTP
ncbi:MAG: serine/threonine-protein phosphatase Pgam5, mitochondrial-like isoform [Verrucomicrobia bacterium]|nr:serine/threonine-protein phosphatase Pgam5, mitochondrial-like isoform [Verrucomicrobiota bacterium]